MECADRVNVFCAKQKSMKAALEKFVEWFMEDYAAEEQEEQEILSQCVQQLFRKYYYSALNPEMTLTPAKIVTTLCKREFGNRIMPTPVLDCTFKGKKLTRLAYHFTCFGTDNHPMVNDLTCFLEIAVSGLQMETPGIPCIAEYTKLQKKIWIFDRHYINILGLVALEAGYIECSAEDNRMIGKTTPEAQAYLEMTNEAKLQRLLELTVIMCSKKLTQTFPELGKEFSILRIAGFLRNPKRFETVMGTVYKKMGLDLKRLDRSILTGSLDVTLQALNASEDNLIKLFELQRLLDVYFFTPFGYYLHMIQPVYPEIYDLTKELDVILVDLDNFMAIRNKLFSSAIDFDLTVLGELLADEGKQSFLKKDIPSKFGDQELFQAVLDSTGYLESAYEALFEDEVVEDFLHSLEDDLRIKPATEKKKKAKLLDFPGKMSGSNRPKEVD